MAWEAWTTIVLALLVIVALVRNQAGPDTVLLAALTVLMTMGLFSDGLLPTPSQAVAGFGNDSLITIGVLFVMAAGLSRTGAMELLTQPLLGRPRTVLAAQFRLMFPVAALSAFLNNTPIVAIFMPVVGDWCRKTGLASSKLYIPLSYAAILGGACTLIGTSTNLVVYGLVLEVQQEPTVPASFAGIEIGMFTISAVGLPAALVGIGYVLIVSKRLLPDRSRPDTEIADARRYTVEMLVEPGSAVDGRSIEQAGLRHLPGVYLVEIERRGDRLVAVGPEQLLRGGDRLIFAGVVSSVVDLQKIRGLVPATNQVFKISDPRPNRCLVEAVVSDSGPLVGRSIREGRFRNVYDAAVIAVHRGGAHLDDRKIGDIVLKPGDTLLIETHPRFVEQNRNRKDFYLVSAVADSRPLLLDRAWIALTILIAMVILVTLTRLSLMNGALLAGGLMVLTRCVSPHDARANIDWRILITIGAAIGFGKAMGQSGAAQALGELLLGAMTPLGPYGVLAGVYLAAMLFNMMIGNIASAVLVFPIARVVAETQQYNFMPFAMAIMMASSASYATPISYPTNLMVYGAGGYRFSDYVKIGLPLNLLIMAVTVLLAPSIWPLR